MELEKSIALGLNDIKDKLHKELNYSNCVCFYIDYVILKSSKDAESMSIPESIFHSFLKKRKEEFIDKLIILYNCNHFFGYYDICKCKEKISIANALTGLYHSESWITTEEMLIDISSDIGADVVLDVILNEIDMAVDLAKIKLGCIPNDSSLLVQELYDFKIKLSDEEKEIAKGISNDYVKKEIECVKTFNNDLISKIREEI